MDNDITDIIFTEDDLVTQDAIDKVTSEYCGAVSVFIGTTRDQITGKRVLNLEYECYLEMAKKEVLKICDEIRSKWSKVRHIVIWHRMGSVPVKEASVIIAISSPRRAEAMSATQWCIDAIKTTVPIWKKEVYTDGTFKWMENKECSWKENSSSENHHSSS